MRVACEFKANRAIVADGTLQLQRHLESQGDNSLLLPYLGSFLKFLSVLAEDHHSNTRITIHLLEILSLLFNTCSQALAKQSVIVVNILLKIGFESKVQVKSETFGLLRRLMQLIGADIVLDIVLPQLEHKVAKFRRVFLPRHP